MGRMSELWKRQQSLMWRIDCIKDVAETLHSVIESMGFANTIYYSEYMMDYGVQFTVSSLTTDVRVTALAREIDIIRMHESRDALKDFVLLIADKFKNNCINFYRIGESDNNESHPIFEKACPHCGASLVYRQNENIVQCDYCKSFVNR